MGIHVIKMPDIGEGIAEVELVAWHVKPGDRVVEDQVLADVMTEKASVEIPSPVAGEVMALGGEIGQVLAVGSELIRIEVEGAGNVKAAASAAAAASAKALAPAPAAKPAAAANKPASPTALVPVPSLPAHEPARPLYADRPIASPSVRRRAWELGVDLAQVPASGTAGRIMQADLDAYAARDSGARPATRPTASLIPLAPRGVARRDEEAIKLIGLRRKIAQKMQEAKRRIPHFSYVEEVDVTELEALRARLNAKWGAQRPRLTVLPFLVRALVLSLREHPEINAR
ncbi:MAG TPA: dihydrolipoamide acetyltransferase family protein, partial [Methylibium sp.]